MFSHLYFVYLLFTAMVGTGDVKTKAMLYSNFLSIMTGRKLAISPPPLHISCSDDPAEQSVSGYP